MRETDHTQSQGGRPRIPPAPRRRVLVVDDHRDTARVLAVLLGALGHDARAATSGEQALLEVVSFQPEVVVLDLGMPNVDGYEIARRLRARPEGAELKLIALTGSGLDDDRRRTREAGFDRHLVKPIDARVLQEVLAGL